MPYRHYGNIGDVWKHLPLCEILTIERPRTYVETNAAYATYTLEGTPRQHYGVGHIYRHGDRSKVIADSRYLRLLRQVNSDAPTPRIYLGSPTLAMQILKGVAERFIFFDIEAPALASNLAYARDLGLETKVETVLGDSVAGAYRLLPGLSEGAFIHIDPYTIFEPNAAGQTYFDLFLEVTRRGVRCMLWYGYFTEREQREIAAHFADAIASDVTLDPARIYGAEVWLDLMQPETIITNPGIVGCGVVTGNLSQASRDAVADLAQGLVEVYKESIFEAYPGRLRAGKLNLSAGDRCSPNNSGDRRRSHAG